jgi:hypothetical protein
MRLLLILLMLGFLTSCGGGGKPLPLIDKNDPTFALTPDHLTPGTLPQ